MTFGQRWMESATVRNAAETGAPLVTVRQGLEDGGLALGSWQQHGGMVLFSARRL